MARSKLCALTFTTRRRSTPGPWYSRGERSLIKQREELYRCCSLIYKRSPILRMLGASARCPCLHAPVETVTPPRQTKLAPLRFRGLRKSRENCVSARSVFLSNPDPLALGSGFVKNDGIDEACSVPLPRFPKEPRKLHIRSLRLPFRSGARGFGSVENVRTCLPFKLEPASLGFKFVQTMVLTKPAPFRFRGFRKSPESSISIGFVFLSDPKRRASDRWRTIEA